MTYNCENAFDTIPAQDHDDTEFLPDGMQHWTRWRFSQKMNRIAQVVLAADTLHPLDLMVLQEVESDTVMEWLLHRTPLASVGYEYVMTASRDPRGINVALVYQPFTFRLIATECIGLSDTFLQEHDLLPTRDILHVCGRCASGDTLDIFAVHLPSRLGGREGQLKRRGLQRLLFDSVDSILTARPSANVIVAGDFNESPSKKTARRFPSLRNLMLGRKGGSYKFHGHWEWIDQVWVSKSLCDGPAHLSVSTDNVRALALPFLLERDEAYGGVKPFRTFYGPAYHRGYSDHLPVVLTFRQR
ncbi:MAG: endonuclease/exonuclease/phosphatase family protein [Bacteroidaceae bacterium]|nr:endonuclease/exonuclease/phosphatase family protein [Bacteroidaceae bacterium]